MTDYEKIKQEIQDLFDSLNFNFKIRRLENDHKGRCYRTRVTFARGIRAGQGIQGVDITVPWAMGYGLFWERKDGFYRKDPKTGEYYFDPALFGSIPIVRTSDEDLLPAELTQSITNKYVNASEVFARVCCDALSAGDMTPAEYSREFLDNEDSHKGHLTHAECLGWYHTLCRMVGKENVEKFAELSNQL